MHTFRGSKGTVFIHNEDFSGNVRLRVNITGADIGEVPGTDIGEVPGTDLLEFVAYIVRIRRITQLEQMTDAEILGFVED